MGKIERISGAGDRKLPLPEFERLFSEKRNKRRFNAKSSASSANDVIVSVVVSPDGLGANIDVKA